MKSDKKYKPFSTDKQFANWRIKNCDTCKKTFNEAPGFKIYCILEFELWLAFFEGGMKKNSYKQITEETAKAIGYLDNKECYIWKCPKWEGK